MKSLILINKCSLHQKAAHPTPFVFVDDPDPVAGGRFLCKWWQVYTINHIGKQGSTNTICKCPHSTKINTNFVDLSILNPAWFEWVYWIVVWGNLFELLILSLSFWEWDRKLVFLGNQELKWWFHPCIKFWYEEDAIKCWDTNDKSVKNILQDYHSLLTNSMIQIPKHNFVE